MKYSQWLKENIKNPRMPTGDKFEIKKWEDSTTISLKNKGKIVITDTFPEYEFSDELSEKEMSDLGIDEQDNIVKIEHIEVEDNSKGQGIGKKLMNKALYMISKKNVFPVYLNASPMGYQGLPLDALTKFYESFGFKVFKKQGHNNLMLLNKADLKMR